MFFSYFLHKTYTLSFPAHHKQEKKRERERQRNKKKREQLIKVTNDVMENKKRLKKYI